MRDRVRPRRGDKDITAAARVIYRAAFNGEALPKRWRVLFIRKRGRYGIGPRSGTLGRCSWSTQTIVLHREAWTMDGFNAGRVVKGSSWLGALIHEFIHQRCRQLRHGQEFNRLTAAAYERLWQH